MTNQERKDETLKTLREAAQIARAVVAYYENLELDRSEYAIEEFEEGDFSEDRLARGMKAEIFELAARLGITSEDIATANEEN